MPQYLARHLENVASLMPCSQHNSDTGVPASFCFNMAGIRLSVYRDFFIENLCFFVHKNSLLLTPAIFREYYHHPRYG
jgi:hypothetical protein